MTFDSAPSPRRFSEEEENFLFMAVKYYAQELAQIIPQTAAETWEMHQQVKEKLEYALQTS